MYISLFAICDDTKSNIPVFYSDGIIRVFSSEESRQADEEAQKAYEELLASSAIPAQIGDIPASELHGPEALFIPGMRWFVV